MKLKVNLGNIHICYFVDRCKIQKNEKFFLSKENVTKKGMKALLSRNKIFINQIFMKKNIYSVIFLRIVELSVFIHSKIDLFIKINFTEISKNDENCFTITHASMDFKTGFYGLNKKNQKCSKNGFIFNRIVKLTTKMYSNLSNKNICHYLKHRIPMCHRQFFRLISQNPECDQTHCNELNNLYQFSCRKWYLYNNPQC